MRRLALTAVAATSLTSCSAVLDGAGPASRRIADLWWLMFWLGIVPVLIVTLLIILAAAWKRRGAFLTEQRMIVHGGVVLSALLLAPVLVMTALVERELRADHGGELTIEVIGHQFWWEVIYPDPVEGDVVTANEIHIPAGVPVLLRVTSQDVIHSVWVPQLHGKIDMIPGRVDELTIEASEPGEYRGQCAEFCGLSHALMAFLVVASPQDEFDAWLEQQRQPASVDVDTGTLQTFANSCAPCHTVRGLFDDPTFEGWFGPDLTHLASRQTIGANLLPNTPEALARWILDPQGVKPGNRMPDVGLDEDDLNDILDLLSQLE